MKISRRSFIKICAAGMGSSTLVAMGFSPTDLQASVRHFKLARTTETRSTCPYCSVSCGVIMYSLGSGAKNAHSALIHIEGDPDNPVNRGTLCPKGAGLLDMIKSPSRLQFPEYRAPGSNQWQRISWDDAIERIARLMKEDRDQHFITHNDKGERVNRWNTTGFLASSAASNEAGYLSAKIMRSLGMVTVDTQARI
jgi:formate dehydrogenase major subunit